MVVDATGLKVYGEGEWKMRAHGKGKRRTWRKFHLAMDTDSFQIVGEKLSTSERTAGEIFPELLQQTDAAGKLGKVYADAAYRGKKCFDAVAKRGGEAIIDVPEGMSLASETSLGLRQRNRIMRTVWASGGKKQWREKSGYHRRSLVETQISRWKKIFGGSLSSRKFNNQKAETRMKAMILNRLTSLGMPNTKAIPA